MKDELSAWRGGRGRQGEIDGQRAGRSGGHGCFELFEFFDWRRRRSFCVHPSSGSYFLAGNLQSRLSRAVLTFNALTRGRYF